MGSTPGGGGTAPDSQNPTGLTDPRGHIVRNQRTSHQNDDLAYRRRMRMGADVRGWFLATTGPTTELEPGILNHRTVILRCVTSSPNDSHGSL